MSTKQRLKSKWTLTRYIERSVLLGAILCIPAVVLLVVSAVLGGTAGVVLATIGGAILTVALLSFLYDPFLKDVLAREIFERLEIRESVGRAGLQSIEMTRDLRLGELIAGSRSIRVLPYDPLEWAGAQYGSLLTLARDTPVNVEVYLPAADDPFTEILSDRLRVGEPEVRARLNALALELGQAWDAEARHEGATLRVWRYTGLCATGLLECDSRVVIEVGPSLRYPLADRTTISLVFTHDSPPADWLKRQFMFPEQEGPSRADERPLGRPSARELPTASAPPSDAPDDSLAGEVSEEG
jgi:hypothetical protein